MNTLMGAMKLRQLGQEGELNAMTLAERKGATEFLKGKKLSDPEVQNALVSQFGETGRKLSETGSRITTAATGEDTRRQALAGTRLLQYRDAMPPPEAGKDALLSWFQQQKEDPTLAGTPIANKSMADIFNSIPTDPQKLNEFYQRTALGMTKFTEMNKPQFMAQDVGGTKRVLGVPGMGGPASEVAGGTVATTMTPAQEREAKDSATRIKQEGQRIGLDARRVGVLEQDAAQKSDPAFQQQMAAAKATGTAIAQGDVKATQALPKIINEANMAVNIIDQMVGKQAVKDTTGKVIQAATAPHPGFQDAVGATWKPGFRFVPGTNAATFQSFQDQIEGAAFLSAFESLKGGGAISEKEGAKATAARMRMKTSTDEKSYMEAAREFQDVMRKGVETARSRVPGASSSNMPAPAAGGTNIDALLDKYK
jgi:hypothetical protein